MDVVAGWRGGGVEAQSESIARACGKTTVSARPMSSPVTEHRMSGLLLMDVPW